MTTKAELVAAIAEQAGLTKEQAKKAVDAFTDSVVDEVKQWQQRPLEPTYLVVYLDGLMVKNLEEGIAHNKCVYLALGINTEGRKDEERL